MIDPFSDILSLLGTRSVRGTSLDASGAWALAFDGRARLKFVAVTRGGCWLLVPGREPEWIGEGDVVLLSDTRYAVASDPDLEPVDGMELFAGPDRNAVRLGDGSQTEMIGGGSGFAEGCAPFVLEALPRFLRIDRGSPSAQAVVRTLASLRAAVQDQSLGSSLIAARLADILVVEAVRAFVADGFGNTIGWIAALADPRLARAIALMHGDVARRWTSPVLAREVGMSRSAFTSHFTRRVGRPPMDYLTHWRMVLARQKLAAGTSVADVAQDVGYASQSAFTQAFKRTVGRTPRSGP
ncbi:AraC family transcriptional regulator [Aureimonas jatrophae]|jgi:AraC-like DNA-binding protein|uniref:AraC-type DNA-binding protein n=1 Tax=Aureimonas jatrophae TaxID=1166073 RepID=A0A1H0FC57_9HYPH|nr:AraC family transcriptional regulator [Aureimonas jatrophae]MBB3950082.1 AraC-like DNA-binding protein [Aureimonas jatrophae]SDN92253.1 AraC-type DNA-binding protein [Aureimonas jatrophae]